MIRRFTKLAARLLAIGSTIGLVACTAAKKHEPPLTSQQREAYVASFDKVWTTVKDRHWDPTLGGVDWDAAGRDLRPKVESAATPGEARAAMTELLARLGKSHYGIIAAAQYAGLEQEQGGSPKGEGETGISVRVIGDQAVVSRVRAGSAADKAGIKPGWVVAEVAGRPTHKAITAVRAAMSGRPELDGSLALLVEHRLKGEPGEPLPLVLLDANDRRTPISLTLDEPFGRRAVFGNLPPLRVTFDARRVPLSPVGGQGDAGYVAFSLFFDPPWLMPQLQEAIESYESCKGVVLDLRGNLGGMILLGMGVGGWFVAEPGQKLGTMVTRESTLNIVLNPRLHAFAGPVAVLVDGSSMSCSEIVAGGLKDLGRARVFGVRTAGACLPSTVERLPSGDGLQYAFADYISAGGRTLEGNGVEPDVVVPYTRESLLKGDDAALTAALRWIAAQPTTPGGT